MPNPIANQIEKNAAKDNIINNIFNFIYLMNIVPAFAILKLKI